MNRAFVPALRGVFLFLSNQPRVRRWAETSTLAHRLTRRFIAGLQLQDAIAAAEQLSQAGVAATLDHLGENVAFEEEAEAAYSAGAEALRRAAAQKLDSTIAVKLTALGLDLDEPSCRRRAAELTAVALQAGSRVEFDMESSAYTDRTLSIVQDMHARSGRVRAVIQAYLYRSEADVEQLSRAGIPIRLCKGAYREPSTVAFPKKRDVDAQFVKLMRCLLDSGTYPAIATHDPAIIGQALEHIRLRGIPKEQFEFQMLYGVRRDLQRTIVNEGFRLRVYVPYGKAWYPYFMRRLAERPANVLFLARSFLKG